MTISYEGLTMALTIGYGTSENSSGGSFGGVKELRSAKSPRQLYESIPTATRGKPCSLVAMVR